MRPKFLSVRAMTAPKLYSRTRAVRGQWPRSPRPPPTPPVPGLFVTRHLPHHRRHGPAGRLPSGTPASTAPAGEQPGSAASAGRKPLPPPPQPSRPQRFPPPAPERARSGRPAPAPQRNGTATAMAAAPLSPKAGGCGGTRRRPLLLASRNPAHRPGPPAHSGR